MGKTLNVSSYHEPDIKFFSRWHWKDTGGGKASPAGTGAVHWKVVRMGAIWVVLCPDTHPEHTISQWPPSSCLVWWSLPSALKHSQWVAGLPPTVVLNPSAHLHAWPPAPWALLTSASLGCFLPFQTLRTGSGPGYLSNFSAIQWSSPTSSPERSEPQLWEGSSPSSLSFLRYFQHYIPFFFLNNNGPILFYLYIFNILYIYLAVPAPSYGTQDLWFSLMACGIVAVKRKTEEWVFLFPFPENKKAKENSEQAWTFLVFFFFHFNCS